jgi:hypothetical protein
MLNLALWLKKNRYRSTRCAMRCAPYGHVKASTGSSPHTARRCDNFQLVIISDIAVSLTSRSHFDLHQCAIELAVINIISNLGAYY